MSQPADGEDVPGNRAWCGPAAGGLMLLAATVLAMWWANSPWAGSYARVWGWPLRLFSGPAAITHSAREWINDGVMAIFFLQVGLEIMRELRHGHLRSPRQASLPLFAALGGMVVPGAIFLGVCHGGAYARGWAIPIATDIAFALGVLSVLGRAVPVGVRVFLTTLATLDDLGAVLVIAVFYSSGISYPHLAGALLLLGVAAIISYAGVRALAWYLALGVGIWWSLQASGIPGAISGVALAVVVPAGAAPAASTAAGHPASSSPAAVLERVLQPYVIFGILPLFALANAGIPLHALGAPGPGHAALRMALGILLGLVVGKPLGVLAASVLAVRSNLARLPNGVRWSQLLGAACLAGIGFTMSLYIAGLAFAAASDTTLAVAAVLVASLLAAATGVAALWMARAR